MADTLHCLTPPSYLKQLMLCGKSLPSDALALDDTNVQAQAGTTQHALLNQKLSIHFGLPTNDEDFSMLTQDELDEVDEVYQKVLTEYSWLKKRYSRIDVLLEQKVDLDGYLPSPSWGFVDIAFIGHKVKPNKNGYYDNTTIYVLDAKFGRVKVDVLSDNNLNPQLCAYWCGIYDLFKETHEVKRGKFMILQPKLKWYPTVAWQTKYILNCMNQVIAPSAFKAVDGTSSYNPSLDNCKYCKNKIHCKYNNAQALALMQLVDEPEMLDDSVIEDLILPNVNNLKKYCDSILAYCIKKSEETGKKWKGFTLSTGRPTRVYTDEEQVKSIALANGYKDIVVESILTPAQAEKLMGKETFSNLVGDLVTYKPGKATLVADAPQPKASKKELKKEFKEIF